MAIVSVDIEAMIEYVAALESAIRDSRGASADLQSKCMAAGVWDADCASFNGGESTAQLEALLMDARRRLALAQIIALSIPGGLSVAEFDDSYLSVLSREEVRKVVEQVISLLADDSGEISEELVDLLAQNSIDPYFAQELANRLPPQRLADCLGQINEYRSFGIETEEQAISFDEMYHSLLFSLADSYSLAAHGTGDLVVSGFTTTWQSAIKGMEDTPYGHEQVILLSLVIERGQWPDDFLEGVFDTIRDLEGTDGVEHWALAGPLYVPIDPWPPDPENGGFLFADDPMGGVLTAMANNPHLVGELFSGGPPTPIDIGNGTQADVDSRLWWILHDRGATDCTINALAQALPAALCVPPVENGEAWQSSLATDLEKISQAFEEESRVADAEFKRGIPHMILDVLGCVPAVGETADLTNAAWYAVEGDWGNAGMSLAAAVPFVGYIAVGGKWVKNTLNAADLAKILKAAELAKTLDATSLHKMVARGDLWPGRFPPSRPVKGATDGGVGAWTPINRGNTKPGHRNGARYQEQITGVTGNGRAAMEYRVPYDPGNPTKNPYVDFDGYVQRGNPPEDVFLEAKHGYEALLFGKGKWTGNRTEILEGYEKEATGQLRAVDQTSPGARIEWHFSDEAAASLVRDHFKDKGFDIVVVFTP